MPCVSRRYPYFFRTAASDVYQALALRALVQALNLDHIATIATSDAYASALATAFESVSAALGPGGVTVCNSTALSHHALSLARVEQPVSIAPH